MTKSGQTIFKPALAKKDIFSKEDYVDNASKNKTAIITGSNRGIGKSMLNIFSEHGANIIACVRKADKDFINEISRLQKKYDNQISYKNLNFENEQECLEIGKQISLEFSEIDILINNAGAIQTFLFQMTPIKNLKKFFKLIIFPKLFLHNK